MNYDFPFSALKAGPPEGTMLARECAATGKLPSVIAVETRGTDLALRFERDLVAEEQTALRAVVAAHDGAAATIVVTREDCKLVVDDRTERLQAIRRLATMSKAEIDAGGDAVKVALDAATSTEECIAAVEADTRPRPLARLGT